MGMLVTEGAASRRDRRLCLIAAAGLFAASVLLFALVPALAPPFVWFGLGLGLLLALRHLVLSFVARFVRAGPTPEAVSRPSITLLIPCLNELRSLEQAVPGMMKLRYEGRLLFCYVCEGASTDGSIRYLRQRAQEDPRIVPIEKTTPPAGRGAAVAYGLAHAPPGDVVGFLDADHIVSQDSLDEIARTFGRPDAPHAVQGACATVADSSSVLARLLTVERQWLEKVELEVNPRLGGICYFGGGQGFFVRHLFDEGRFAIDETMILDDIDLSCQLALNGTRVVFNPRIVTRSRQPETVPRFLDQRLRWARGWVQLAGRYALAPFRRGPIPLGFRADLLRVVLTPTAGGLLCFSFAAALAMLAGAEPGLLWPAAAALLWPFLLVPAPCLAGVRPARASDAALAAIGIPLLMYAYCWVMGTSLVDAYVLRRPARYAKTPKDP